MNLDEGEYAREIKLNKYGQVDVEYYYAQARQMRSECTVEMFQYGMNAIKSAFFGIADRLVGFKGHPSH